MPGVVRSARRLYTVTVWDDKFDRPHLSVAARTIVWADSSMRCTSVLLGHRQTTDKQHMSVQRSAVVITGEHHRAQCQDCAGVPGEALLGGGGSQRQGDDQAGPQGLAGGGAVWGQEHGGGRHASRSALAGQTLSFLFCPFCLFAFCVFFFVWLFLFFVVVLYGSGVHFSFTFFWAQVKSLTQSVLSLRGLPAPQNRIWLAGIVKVKKLSRIIVKVHLATDFLNCGTFSPWKGRESRNLLKDAFKTVQKLFLLKADVSVPQMIEYGHSFSTPLSLWQSALWCSGLFCSESSSSRLAPLPSHAVDWLWSLLCSLACMPVHSLSVGHLA